MHPSWRDLVIDELSEDAPARQRFLSACGIDGVDARVLRAGGAAGERTLPLLVDDADWDALGDGFAICCASSRSGTLARVLLALGRHARLPAPTGTGGAGEARLSGGEQSLGHGSPSVGRADWDSRCRCSCSGVVRGERADRRAGGGAGARPTWVELHPGSALLVERPDPAELARAEEWLELAQTLRRYDPAALEGLGFFGRDRDLLERLIVALAARRRSTRSCGRCARACSPGSRRWSPISPGRPQRAARSAGSDRRPGPPKRWWVPEDIPAPPSTEPATAVPTQFNREDVDRVLRDL